MKFIDRYFKELETLSIDVVYPDEFIPYYRAAKYEEGEEYFKKLLAMEGEVIRKLTSKVWTKVEPILHSLAKRLEELENAENECRELTKKWDIGEFVDADFEQKVLGRGKFTSSFPMNANYTSEFLDNIHLAIMYKGCSVRGVISKVKEYFEAHKGTLSKSKTEQTGFDLGFSEPQLEALHKALIDKGYLDKNTKQAHFKNAFNGKKLIDFEPLKWIKSIYGAIFLKVNFDTDRKDLKVWQTAEKVFDNGNANSLKNAFKNTDKHNEYFNEISRTIKSLPQFTVN